MNKFIPNFAVSTSFLLVTCMGASLHASSPNQASADYTIKVEQTTNRGPSNIAPADYNQFQRNEVMQGTTDHRLVPQPAGTDSTQTADKKLTIVEIAAQDPSLSTFIKALKTVDLTSVLERPGPYTIFAPNDAAFKKLSTETLDNLFKPENKEKLREILKYHVLPGAVLEADVKADTVFTLNGKPLKITVNGKDVMVGEAKVIKTDIKGSNGVIHIIDTVLIPKK